jgi:hypothetical protein
MIIQPGFSREVPVTFHTPVFNTFVFLSLKVYKDGKQRFCDTHTCFEVVGCEDFRTELNPQEKIFK